MGAAGGSNKPFVDLAGRSPLERVLDAFLGAATVQELVLVGRAQDLPALEQALAARDLGARRGSVIEGGDERADSVRLGARSTSADADVCLLHDVARALVRSDAIDAVARAAGESGAAVLAVPVVDTLKRSRDGRLVTGTVERDELWAAQTPQGLRRELLLSLLDQAEAEGFGPTDDVALAERYGHPVQLVRGTSDNFKLTHPEDLELARALVARREGSDT